MIQSSAPALPQASNTSSAPPPAVSGVTDNMSDGIIDALTTFLGSLHLMPSQAKALIKVIMPPLAKDASSQAKGDLSSKANNSGFELSGIPAEDYITDPNTLSVYVTLDSYSVKSPSIIVIEESNDAFAKVADTMADECFLYYYQGMLYNMPAVANPSPPYYCVTRGRYLGVFNGWDNVAPKVQGVPRAIFSKVDSLEAGEERLRKAIERSEVAKV